MEEHMNLDGRFCRRAEQCRRDYYCYSEDEHETADALILLSVSGGGLCVSSSSSSGGSTSNMDSTTETPALTQISREDKSRHVLRIRVTSKPAKQIAYKCDICDREFGSPQALGGHKTTHRRKPIIPDLNEPLRVYQCSICGNVYDSGPALGGHKRKHRT